MDKVLGVIDWMVLSACNTTAGADAGADAPSGLGRAFVCRHQGASCYELTVRPVRELADIFRRQADNLALTRMEAFRQAMAALMESGEAKDAMGIHLCSSPLLGSLCNWATAVIDRALWSGSRLFGGGQNAAAEAIVPLSWRQRKPRKAKLAVFAVLSEPRAYLSILADEEDMLQWV